MQSLSALKARNQQIKTWSEIELLLCCIRTHLNQSTIERIKTFVEEDIDWEYLIQTAFRHGVLPLLYWNLNKICPLSIPTHYQQQLQQEQFTRTQHNIILTNKLLKLLELFDANNIPVIPFKGPILAISVYGDVSRRNFYDLDIIVRKQDFLKTKELLMANGYRPYANSNNQEAIYLNSLKDEQQKEYLKSHWELHLVDECDGITVDLHHGVLPKQFSFLFDTQWLWEDVRVQSFANRNFLNLSSEDLMLILCSQGAKDCWQQLNRICDIAQLIRTYKDINWDKTYQRAAQLGMTRMLLLGLLLAYDLLEVELPDKIVQQIEANPLLKSFAFEIYAQLFCQTKSLLQNSKVGIFWFHLKMIESPKDKVWYCIEHLLVPTVADWVFLPLPKFLSFLYYLLRPIRLMTTYGLK